MPTPKRTLIYELFQGVLYIKHMLVGCVLGPIDSEVI